MSKDNLKHHNKRLTKAKLLTLGALMFSLGAATSVVATTAWYNIQEFAAVGDLNLQINMEDKWLHLGLKQTPDSEPIFKEDDSGFTKEELGIEDTVLSDVSGMFESDWLNSSTDLTTAFPKFQTRYGIGKNKQKPGFEEDKSVYVQNEFVFVSNFDGEVHLHDSSFVLANVEANKKVAGTDANRLEELNKVVHAVRISFFTDEGYYIVNPGESEETLYGGILDLDNNGYYDYIEEKDDEENVTKKEILYGQYEGTPTYKDIVTEDNPPLLDKNNTFLGNHSKDVYPVDVDSVEIAKENAIKMDEFVYNKDNHRLRHPICHVEQGVPKRIIVSIYVEGWDRHMIDGIAEASFDVNIAFTGLVGA